MNTAQMPVIYWISRGFVVTIAAGTLLLAFVGFLMESGSASSETLKVSSLVQMSGGVLILVSYLVPNRIAVTTGFFHIRMAAQILALARVVYMSVLLVSGAYGKKHFAIYPTLAVAILAALLAPILLTLRRRVQMRLLHVAPSII